TRSTTFFAAVAVPFRPEIDAGAVTCRFGIRFEGLDSSTFPRQVAFSPAWPDGGLLRARVFLQPVENRPDFSRSCEISAESSNGLFGLTKIPSQNNGEHDSFDLTMGPLVQYGVRQTTMLRVRGPDNEITVPVTGRTFERCPSLNDSQCRGFAPVLTDGLSVFASDAGNGRALVRDDESAFRAVSGAALVTDIAQDSLGRSWVTTRDSACLVSLSTGVVRACSPLDVPSPVLAAGAGDGGLLIVGGDGLYLVEPTIGLRLEEVVAPRQFGAIEDVALDGDSLWFVSAELGGDVLYLFSMATRVELQRFALGFRGAKGLSVENGLPVVFTDTGFRVRIAADGGTSSSRLVGDWVGAAP
ncbi:MAG: hypothetical protein ABTQ32_01595, partial [Myxococcaceae bacterium]